MLAKILSFLKKFTAILITLFVLFWIFIWNYSFVFKEKVIGEVQAVERVGVQAVVTQGSGPLNPQVFSFSVAIKDLKSSEIHMASSEDRQWGAVQKGNCVIAAYFPYEPWKLTKAGTERNARLIKNYTSCADLPPQEDSFWENVKFFFLF